MANLARKLTLKNVGLDQKAIKEAVKGEKDGTTIAIARFWGVATEGQPGTTDKGPFLKLVGEFGAANLITGERYQAPACILPEFISDSFKVVLADHGKAEFAMEIGATVRDNSITGYEFVARPLMESTASNRLLELQNLATQELGAPKLEAPKASARKSSKK